MATYRQEYDAPSLARFNAKKRELETSMLEYSERMRHINQSRGLVHTDPHDHGRHAGNRLPLEVRAQKQHVYRSEDLDHHRRRSNHYHHHQHDSQHHRDRPFSFDAKDLTDSSSISRTPHSQQHKSRRRPFSFDERELEHNRNISQYAQGQQRRETRSDRPIVIPSGGSVTPESPKTLEQIQNEKTLRVSLVNAADLYDLVDLSAQARGSNGNTAKLADVDAGYQLIEEISMESRKPQNSYSMNPQGAKDKRNAPGVLINPNQGESDEKLTSARRIDVSDNTSLLTGKTIVNDVTREKYRPKVAGGISGEVSAGSVDQLVNSTGIIQEDDDYNAYPLDILLEQAASEHLKSSRKLKLRPKRAKRMLLHRPELLAIPEDGGTFAKSDEHDTARKEMLSNAALLPSNSSLQAIRDMNGRWRRDDDSIDAQTGKGREFKDRGADRSPRKTDDKSDDMYLDKLLATSLYPDVPWEVGGGYDTRSRAVHQDKSSHKEKAQKKMKRLIFLRDQPDHSYRRE